MVRITGFEKKQKKNGESFILLQLEGDLVMVQSDTTGRYYATTKKATMSSTLEESSARAMVGKEILGRIEKVNCQEYDFVIPETGELIKLSHRYEYVPHNEPTPLRVVTAELVD